MCGMGRRGRGRGPDRHDGGDDRRQRHISPDGTSHAQPPVKDRPRRVAPLRPPRQDRLGLEAECPLTSPPMTDDVRNIVLGVIAAGISAALGWLARTYLWRRKLRRKQAFFGLPGNSECLLVVNR